MTFVLLNLFRSWHFNICLRLLVQTLSWLFFYVKHTRDISYPWNCNLYLLYPRVDVIFTQHISSVGVWPLARVSPHYFVLAFFLRFSIFYISYPSSSARQGSRCQLQFLTPTKKRSPLLQCFESMFLCKKKKIRLNLIKINLMTKGNNKFFNGLVSALCPLMTE